MILLIYYSNLLYYLGVTQDKAKINGDLYIRIHPLSKCSIGKNFIVNSEINAIDGGKSIIVVRKGAELLIGHNTGISSTCMYIVFRVTIGNNVKIGAGTVLFDTNFHSLNPVCRNIQLLDEKNAVSAPVYIEDNVFIGAHCIICKGVTIGENSIVAAGSVVIKSIPTNELWGGNPACFIKKMNYDNYK